MASARIVAKEQPLDDIAASDDNLLVESDVAEQGRTTFVRRRVGIISAGMMVLGLIAVASYKHASQRRGITREEFRNMMKKYDALSPVPGFTYDGAVGMTLGECVIDAAEAQGYFGKFAVASGEAQAACALDMGSDDCLTDVLEIFSSLGFMGDFIGKAASQCNMTSSSAAGCSSELAEISSALVEIARQALEINRTCVPQFAEVYAQSIANKELWDVSKCLVDVDLLADHGTKGGIFLGQLEKECPTNSGAAQEGCAVDILGFIAQLSGSASFMMSGMTDCSPNQFFETVDVMCAEAITDTVGEIFSLATAAAVLPGCAK